MIVRISTEAQYEIDEADIAGLTELDNEAVAACGGDDEARFGETFGRLLEFVRSKGRRISDDELLASDVILPPPDVSMDEARADFSGDGLIPG